MILLRKKISNNNYFDFKYILASGYNIKEDNDRIIQKFANGHRKSINSSYTDVIIKLDLDTFDLNTTSEYLSYLTNGTYQYNSLKDKQYKETEFIIQGLPENVVKNSAKENMLINKYKITLLKAGD